MPFLNKQENIVNLFFRGNLQMKKLLLVLLLSLSSLTSVAQELYVVDEPDIAEQGWWWLPSESGWGLNITIQPAGFSPSGYFMFGSIFTYDTDGKPTWYTFSGEYTPNSDVYSWREGRGVMGSFDGPLYVTDGGNCPTCPYSANTAQVSDLGNISIKWSDPLNASMRIGDSDKEIVYQYYHAGLQANNADFITEGAWYVQSANDSVAFKGLVEFESLDLGDTLDWTNDDLYLDPSYNWYHSMNTPVIYLREFSGESIANVGAVFSSSYNEYFVLLAYNPENNIAHTFIVGNFPISSTDSIVSVDICTTKTVLTSAGILRPAVSSNTRLYFSEGVLDNCDPSTLSETEKRQVFVSLTRIPQGGADMALLPAFQNRE